MRVAIVLFMLLVASPAWAQLAVAEAPGPLLEQTIWGSTQQTLNTIEAFFHSEQWILEMTSFKDSGLGGSFETDLDTLAGLIGETQGILWEAQAILADIERLYGLEGAPDNATGLQERLTEARYWHYARKLRAQQMQALPGRIVHMVDRIKGLWSRILGVTGAKQTGQQLQSMLQHMQLLESQSQVIAASYQQIMLAETLEKPLIEESMDRINKALMADYPGN